MLCLFKYLESLKMFIIIGHYNDLIQWYKSIEMDGEV